MAAIGKDEMMKNDYEDLRAKHTNRQRITFKYLKKSIKLCSHSTKRGCSSFKKNLKRDIRHPREIP